MNPLDLTEQEVSMCTSDECCCCTRERIRSLTQNHALHAFLEEEESAMEWGLFDALSDSDTTVKMAMRHWYAGQSGDADIERDAEAAAADLPDDTGVLVRAVYKASMAFLIENWGEHPEPEPEPLDDYRDVWDDGPHEQG
jgi:hypothetical protein